jgi:hypothetical protein
MEQIETRVEDKLLRDTHPGVLERRGDGERTG